MTESELKVSEERNNRYRMLRDTRQKCALELRDLNDRKVWSGNLNERRTVTQLEVKLSSTRGGSAGETIIFHNLGELKLDIPADAIYALIGGALTKKIAEYDDEMAKL